MANEDDITIRAKLGRLDEAIERGMARLNESIAKAEAIGDEVLVSQLRAQQAQLQSPTTGARQTPQIEQDTAALRAENEVRQQGLRTELETLDTIRAQSAARMEDLVLVERLQRGGTGQRMPWPYQAYQTPPEALTTAERLSRAEAEAAAAAAQRSVVLPPTPRYSAAGPLAGQQVAAEEQAAALRKVEEEQQRLNALKAGEEAANRRILDELRQQAIEQRAAAQAARDAAAASYEKGYTAAAGKRVYIPEGENVTAMEREAAALGQYEQLAGRASLQTDALSANFIRLGIAENESSDSLRRHGALTTEYLTALARGETTVAEFGYQIGATTAKFAGWTAAAAATYGALGAVFEFGKGAVDASSGVERLNRTIEGVNTQQANQAIQQLSRDTNVSVKEAADAIFQYSRTFHTVDDAATAAGQGLSTLKLDNVSLADAVRLSTQIHQQFGVTAQGLQPVYDMLAAGQREYNARISDSIPLLRASTGAVRNAGGDLNQLVQLAVLAARVVPGIGGQIGTAFARSASVVVPKNLPQLQREFGLGFGNQATDWTALFEAAVRRGGTLAHDDRRKLANLIFDPRYGSRLGGLFSPQAAQQLGLEQTTITPRGAAGSLQSELQKELATASERFHSITNEIQRTGAALGSSGIINVLSGMAQAGVAVGHVFGDVINTFDSLPNAAKETAEALLLVRGAMLFISRTRFGQSLGDLTHLSNVPGFRPSDADRARNELTIGNRAALNNVSKRLAQLDAELATTARQQVVLEEQRAAAQAEIEAAEAPTAAQLERSNAIKIRIAQLEEQANRIELERNATLDVQADLKARQLGLSSVNRTTRYSDDEVNALNAEVTAGTVGTSTAEQTTRQRLAAQKARLAAASAANAAATERAAVAEGRSAAAAAEEAAVSGAAAGAAGAEAGAMTRLAAMKARLAAMLGRGAVADAEGAAAETTALTAAAAGEATAASTGLLSRLGGLAAAFDPWLAALIALPLGIGAVKEAIDASNKASKEAQDALRHQYPGNATQQLLAQAGAVHQAAQQQHGSDFLHTVLPYVGLGFAADYLDPAPANAQDDPIAAARKKAADAAKKQQQAAAGTVDYHELQDLGRHYEDYAAQFQRDAVWMVKTKAGREQLYRESQQLQGAAAAGAQTVFQSGGANDPLGAGRARTAFHQWLQGIYNAAIAKTLGGDPGGDIFGAVENLRLVAQGSSSPAQLPQYAQAFDDSSKLFGTTNANFRKAVIAYAQGARTAFAAMAHAKTSDQLAAVDPMFQAVSSMQSNLVNSVNSAVQNDTRRAQSASTVGGANAALSDAQSRLASLRGVISGVLKTIEREYAKHPEVIKAAQRALGPVDADIGDSLKTINTDYLNNLQLADEIAVSSMRGISPEADMARAAETLRRLKARLAVARSRHMDATTIGNLEKEVNDSQTANAKQTADYALALIDAHAKLDEARVPGSGPIADLHRAHIQLKADQHKLEQLKKSGAGTKATLDQAAVVASDQQTINNDAQSYAQTLLQSQNRLATARITGTTPASDIARAQSDLAGAYRQLALDQSQHKDQPTINNDLADIYDKQRSLVESQKSGVADNRELIQNQTRLRAANVRGSTPRADMQRARIELAGLLQLLQYDQANNAPLKQIVADEADIAEKRQQIQQQATTNARDLLDVRDTLRTARITGIGPNADIRRAKTDLDNARRVLAFDRSHNAGLKQILQDQADVFDKERALHEAIQQHASQVSSDLQGFLQAQGNLAESQTTDPVQRAEIELNTARRILASIKPSQFKTQQEYLTALLNAQADVNNKRTAVAQAIMDTDMSTLDFELHTNQITNAQYVAGLQSLLSMKQLTLQQRQSILSKIYDIEHQSDVSLNLGDIKMPTTYEVERAIKGAVQRPIQAARNALMGAGGDGGSIHDYMRAGAVPAAVAQNTNTITINVSKDTDMSAFAAALEQAVNGNFTGAAQAAGII